MKKSRRKIRYNLNDSPFFRLRSRKKLAKLLRVNSSALEELSRSNSLYVRRWKHKKYDRWLKSAPSDADADIYRPIDIPDPKLKAIQTRIAILFSRIAPPEFLFSPVKGRSYVENAAYHVNGTAFWLLDVADYFPSCSDNNVASFFRRYLECSPDVAAIITRLVTLDGCLPQGSPCSPILAYYSNCHMWIEIAEIAASAGCKTSLYADDITISGAIIPKSIIWEIKKAIHRNGFRLKSTKEVSLINSPADVTGVIVKEGKTYLPNRQHKRIVELKQERDKTIDPKLRAELNQRIFGRFAQRRQVEQPKIVY